MRWNQRQGEGQQEKSACSERLNSRFYANPQIRSHWRPPKTDPSGSLHRQRFPVLSTNVVRFGQPVKERRASSMNWETPFLPIMAASYTYLHCISKRRLVPFFKLRNHRAVHAINQSYDLVHFVYSFGLSMFSQVTEI